MIKPVQEPRTRAAFCPERTEGFKGEEAGRGEGGGGEALFILPIKKHHVFRAFR